jgi:hypothetical protein
MSNIPIVIAATPEARLWLQRGAGSITFFPDRLSWAKSATALMVYPPMRRKSTAAT